MFMFYKENYSSFSYYLVFCFGLVFNRTGYIFREGCKYVYF